MLGTIVNALAVLAGGVVGSFLKRGVSKKINETILMAMGLFVVLIGLKSALQLGDFLLMIFALAIGGAIGEAIDIEAALTRFGEKVETRLGGQEHGIAKGFVTTTLVYCVGSMAIVGSIESGLTGVHTTLFAKAAIDGITAVVFASTLGIGVALSSISILLYQGTITILAGFLKGVFVGQALVEISAIGGLLVAAIGLNIMGISKIRVGNLLPSIFLVMLYFVVKSFL